ncbi:secretory subunit [Thoreauomyces humboldtii]|nr:secretory subunit [Thoreauomyces humboldtii]
MAQYAYDETGAVFNYFLLTILALVLLPTTYSWAFGGAKAVRTRDECDCDRCTAKQKRLAAAKRKEQSFVSTKLILLTLGWSLFAFVAYKASTTVVEETGLWDPYTILGLDHNADDAQIKSAKRKLTLKWHPDKNSDNQEEATTMTAEINKAWKTLTDEEARKNWDEWGHPDGKQSFQLGLALPRWLVEEGNSSKVLFVYTAMFMIMLPALVARWWSKAKHLNKDKILNPTMAKFYRELTATLGFEGLLELVCKADEFYTLITLDKNDAAALDELTAEVATVMAQQTTFTWKKKPAPKDAQTAMQQKVYLLMTSYLLRIAPPTSKLVEEQRLVAETSATLVGGLLQIAISRQWLSIALSVVDLSQMISQALYFHQSPLMQLPNINTTNVKHFRAKKSDVATIRDLIELDTAEQDAVLARFLTADDRQLTQRVAQQYPLLRITKAKFSVLGEPAIIPNAIVTLIVKLQLGTKSDLDADKKNGTSVANLDDPADEEEPKVNIWDAKKEPAPLAHVPYFPQEKRAVWWVYFGDMNQNRLITLGKVNDLVTEQTVRLQFQAPPRPGQWDFQVLVKSDSHIGCDALCELKLVVEPAEAAPLQEEDDDISDPEEDSIAGQMQSMRKPGGANGRKSARDSDSNSDEEESDEATPVKAVHKKKAQVTKSDEETYEDSDSSEEED